MTMSSNDATQPVPAGQPGPERDSTTATMWLDEQLTREQPLEDPTDATDAAEPAETAETAEATDAAGAAEVTEAVASTEPPGTTYLRGPAPTPVIIGLIGLLTLVGTGIWSLTDWGVNWALAAPVAVVAVGLVIIVLGVSGLRRPRS